MNTKFYSKNKKCICGAKKIWGPGPFHIKPKAHVEEEEMPEDE